MCSMSRDTQRQSRGSDPGGLALGLNSFQSGSAAFRPVEEQRISERGNTVREAW